LAARYHVDWSSSLGGRRNLGDDQRAMLADDLSFTGERPESSAPTAGRDVMAKALDGEATMLGALTRKFSPDPKVFACFVVDCEHFARRSGFDDRIAFGTLVNWLRHFLIPLEARIVGCDAFAGIVFGKQPKLQSCIR